MGESATTNSMIWLGFGVMLGALGFQVYHEVSSADRGLPAPPALAVSSGSTPGSSGLALASPPAAFSAPRHRITG